MENPKEASERFITVSPSARALRSASISPAHAKLIVLVLTATGQKRKDR